MQNTSELLLSVASPKRKALLGFFLLVFGIGTWFPLKWGFANAVSSRAELPEVAAFAAELAPADPQTRFARAVLLDATLEPADAVTGLIEFEAATTNSPYNYLIWLELGRAYDRSGQPEKALKALRRAVELAPNYSLPKWTLGNSLLRSGETAEAIEYLLLTARADARFAEPAAVLLLQLSDYEPKAVGQHASSSSNLNDAIISALAREKRLDIAVSLWRMRLFEMSSEGAARSLYQQLVDAKRFRDAVGVSSSFRATASLAAGAISDGGFEERSAAPIRTVFEWNIADGGEPRIGVTDGQKRSGSYSLLIGFGNKAVGFRTVRQIVALDPGSRYEFEAWYRSVLEGLGTLHWEAVDVSTGKRLLLTEPFARSDEWQKVSGLITAPDDVDGVEFRLVKVCSSVECSMSGNLWIDDVSIKQISK